MEKTLGSTTYPGSDLTSNINSPDGQQFTLVAGLQNYTFSSGVKVPKGYMINVWYNPGDAGRIAYDNSGSAPYSDMIVNIASAPMYYDLEISGTTENWRFYFRLLVDAYTDETTTGKTFINKSNAFEKEILL